MFNAFKLNVIKRDLPNHENDHTQNVELTLAGGIVLIELVPVGSLDERKNKTVLIILNDLSS